MGHNLKKGAKDRCCGARLLRLDMFGEAVAFNIAGEKSHTTGVGFCLSILIFALVVIFSVNQFWQAQHYERTSHLAKENHNALDVEHIFGYDETGFALAFGFADSRLRLSRQPKAADLDKYVKLKVEIVRRTSEENDPLVSEVGFHSCTEKDLSYFHPFTNLGTKRVLDIWQHLQCLDDPRQLKFQGGSELGKEQSLRLKVLSCSYSQFDCVTDVGLVDDFLLNLSFLTVFNNRQYEPEVYDPEAVIRKETVLQTHRINLVSP